VSADGSGGDVVDTNNYIVDETGIRLRRGYYTTKSRATIKVSYTYGYSTLPNDVRLAILQAVKAEMQRHSADTEHINSRTKEGEREDYGGAWDEATGLPKQVLPKLRHYKLRDFPAAGMAQRNR
jgi:hypothetical protein